MATSEKKKRQAWGKSRTVRGENPDTWRRSPNGNIIRQGSYGTKGQYGWEIDHKKPKAKGGSDSSRNLQAMHWEENRKKSDKYPKKRRRK
jgi:5-methylcytosine-specific restriction endonuclease McrA